MKEKNEQSVINGKNFGCNGGISKSSHLVAVRLRKIDTKIPVPKSFFNEGSGLETCNVVKK